MDLLIKIPGPLNPAAYLKVQNLSKKVQNLKWPPWRFDKNLRPEGGLYGRAGLIQIGNLELQLLVGVIIDPTGKQG